MLDLKCSVCLSLDSLVTSFFVRLRKSGFGFCPASLPRQYVTMNKQELFESMLSLWNEFEAQHNGTTKKSQQQARKAVGELKKLVTDYRKASVEENK